MKRAQYGYWDERRRKRTWNSGFLADTVWAQWWVMMLFTSQLGLTVWFGRLSKYQVISLKLPPLFIYLFFTSLMSLFRDKLLIIMCFSSDHRATNINRHNVTICVYIFGGKNLMINSFQKLTNESREWNYFSTFRKSFTLFIQIEKASKINPGVKPSTCCCERGGTVDSSVRLSVFVFVLDRETLRKRGKWSGMVGCLVTVTCPGL